MHHSCIGSHTIRLVLAELTPRFMQHRGGDDSGLGSTEAQWGANRLHVAGWCGAVADHRYGAIVSLNVRSGCLEFTCVIMRYSSA